MHRILAVIIAAVLALVMLVPVSATPAFRPGHAMPRMTRQWRPAEHTARQHRIVHRRWHYSPRRWHRAQRAPQRDSGIIGGRPRGCPYEYCGCSASLFIFHRIIAALNLAANWLHFPHVGYPEPGDAAVAPNHHHVLVLVRHIRGPVWYVHDGNSGRHLTRDHARNIAGWTVVDPRHA